MQDDRNAESYEEEILQIMTAYYWTDKREAIKWYDRPNEFMDSKVSWETRKTLSPRELVNIGEGSSVLSSVKMILDLK